MEQHEISHSHSEEKHERRQEWWEELFIYEYLEQHPFQRDSHA